MHVETIFSGKIDQERVDFAHEVYSCLEGGHSTKIDRRVGESISLGDGLAG